MRMKGFGQVPIRSIGHAVILSRIDCLNDASNSPASETMGHNSVVAGAVVAPQKSISPFGQNVDLMEAPRLRAHLLRLALGVLKMQLQEPGIFGIGCEVMCRSQRRSAKVADGIPDPAGS
jgi:hypothetical protein